MFWKIPSDYLQHFHVHVRIQCLPLSLESPLFNGFLLLKVGKNTTALTSCPVCLLPLRCDVLPSGEARLKAGTRSSNRLELRQKQKAAG